MELERGMGVQTSQPKRYRSLVETTYSAQTAKSSTPSDISKG